jgi:hypothetical protein
MSEIRIHDSRCPKSPVVIEVTVDTGNIYLAMDDTYDYEKKVYTSLDIPQAERVIRMLQEAIALIKIGPYTKDES